MNSFNSQRSQHQSKPKEQNKEKSKGKNNAQEKQSVKGNTKATKNGKNGNENKYKTESKEKMGQTAIQMKKYKEVQSIILNEKQIKNEFDNIELKLKNRDISIQQLNEIVCQKLLTTLVKVYQQCEALHSQAARIVLQIYSHYPVRHKLYNNEQNENRISHIVLPLLLHNYAYVNEAAALECMEGLVKEGNVDIVKNIDLMQLNKNSSINDKIRLIVKKWTQNTTSIFVNGILQLILTNLTNYFYNAPNSLKYNETGIHSMLLKQITIQLTAKLTQIIPNINTILTLPTAGVKSLVLNYFKLYLDNLSVHLQLKNSHNDGQKLLLYIWAVFSVLSHVPYQTKNGKNNKCANTNKQIFVSIMEKVKEMLFSNDLLSTENRNTENRQNSPIITNVNDYINFAMTLLFPFHDNSLDSTLKPLSNYNILNNECKLLTVVKYLELFLHVLNGYNIQDNIEESNIGQIIRWVFNLAIFCDEHKKKYKLEALLSNIRNLGIVDIEQERETDGYGFQLCQSLLYKLLLSIQKCLPKYSLKFYSQYYINRPGIFHLYFIDQILFLREPYQIKNFMIDLIQKWVTVEMRDFNMLGYVCKFIMHFLGNKNDGGKKIVGEDRHKILLTFFRELSPQNLVYLNAVFYQPSFSDVAPPQIQVNHYNLQNTNPHNTLAPQGSKSHLQNVQDYALPGQNKSQNHLQPILFSANLPPLTLSSFEHESYLKSCGYSYCEKTIFLDRNFYMAEQILNWSNLLHQLYDDDYYYHCKYFYYLLTFSYSIRNDSTRISNYGEKVVPQSKKIVQKKQRRSLNFTQLQAELNHNVQKIIELWQQAIQKNKVALIHSIFQMLACWAYTYTISNSQANSTLNADNSNNVHQAMKQTHLKSIFHILLQYRQKLLLLPSIYAQNWKQAIKQMQTNLQLFENYKKEENKVKNRQAYFLRCIVMFIQSISSNKIYELIPKNYGCDEVIEIIQKYGIYSGGVVCLRSIRVLSSRAGRNRFLEEALKILNIKKTETNLGKNLRKRLELFRQLMFAYIQQQSEKLDSFSNENNPENGNSSKQFYPIFNNVGKTSKDSKAALSSKAHDFKNSQHSILSQNSNNSQNSTNDIGKLIQFQLKININDIVSECVNILATPLTYKNDTQNNKFALKNEKEELYNKMLSLEILQELYSNSTKNKKCIKIIYHFINIHQNLVQKLKQTILSILFRDSSIIAKYQRKLILSLRSMCLNWVANDGCLEANNFYRDQNRQIKTSKEKNYYLDKRDGKCIGVLNKTQTFLALWHYGLDQQIELRMQVASILTNVYESYRFSSLQKQWYFTCAILTLMRALEPKAKIKLYTQKCLQNYYNKITEKCEHGAVGFFLNLALVIGFLIYNSKVNLPCLDIYENYCTIWLKGNKDTCYLIMSALQIIYREGYKFKTIDFTQASSQIGNDLKLYYMNIKSKRGWIICKERTDNYNYMEVQQKSDTIFKYLKLSIMQKVKNVKFLKAKKEAIFDIEQICKIGEIEILEKLSEKEMRERKEKQEKNKDNFTSIDNFDENQNEDDELDIDQLYDF